ncbi:MAG: TRAP transporter large permease [Pigmentiphaga sp.]|nr:TRAP transporter large permease [Pigmentiphaga sp.]
MEWYLALGILLIPLFLLMGAGIPVAFAFLGVNILGAWLFLGGEVGLAQLVRNSIGSVNNFALAPIPLFVLMGEILLHTGLAFRAINAIEQLIQRVPGRLAIVGVLGGTTFATLSGSSIANTAMMGSVMLPDMLKRGYHPTLAMGPIMAVGGIAMLIPPSALIVMFGSLAGISIAQLLIAGIIPGLLMATCFLAYVILRSRLRPADAPADDAPTSLKGWARWRPLVRDVLPLFLIFVAVVGSILTGWASPTESAAIGVFATLVATVAYRSVSWKGLIEAVHSTVRVSIIILFVMVASTTFAQLLSFSGAASGFLSLIREWNLEPWLLVLGMLAIILVLGCVVEQVSMMMITLPFFMPLIATAGIDPVWFGILMLIGLEIGLLTPPFGLLLMVMQSVAPPSIRIGQIYKAAAPFIVIEIAVLGLLFLVPVLATGLTRWIQ